MEVLLFLLFTVPIFYILGIVYLIKIITNKTAPKATDSRNNFLIAAIKELSKLDPQKKIGELLKEYKKELNLTKGNDTAEDTEELTKDETSENEEPADIPGYDISQFWNNWYSNNSINLLLYVGAFLVVASASIFVGFQWETISGTLKAILLSILAFSFFAFGFWFYSLPKIKNAGTTFIGIGALLIPVAGTAWYNFVLKDLGISLGAAWLMTSLISLVLYYFLALYMKQVFYAYFTIVMTLSTSLSLVNFYSLNQNFYILASIITSFVLLLSGIFLKKLNPEAQKLFQKPVEISSNILMPISLSYGFIIASTQNLLYTAESSISLFLASFYYFASYLISQKPWNLILGEILYPIGLSVFFHWQGFDTTFLLYVVSTLSLGDIALSIIFNRMKLPTESNGSITTGVTKLLIVFIMAILTRTQSLDIFYLTLFPIAAGVLAFYIQKQISFLALPTIFISINTFVLTQLVFKPSLDLSHLSLIYLAYGIILYILLCLYKTKEKYYEIFTGSITLFLLLSLFFGFQQSWNLMISGITISCIAITAAVIFKKKELQYLAHVFVYFAFLNALYFKHIDDILFPFAFAILSYMFYGIHTILPNNLKESYRKIGLAGSLATPIIFGLIAITQSYTYQLDLREIYEKNALLTAYGATIIFALDTFLTKNYSQGYLTSAIGVTTYLWQLKVLGVSEIQWYTGSLGIYFLVLGYIRKLKKDTNVGQNLNFLGLFFLIIPTFFQTFGTNGGFYSLLLIGIGIILIGVGISIKEKEYQYSGIGAITLVVIMRTYEYLLALPRWVVVGGIGLIFLIVAIYLLSKRKE